MMAFENTYTTVRIGAFPSFEKSPKNLELYTTRGRDRRRQDRIMAGRLYNGGTTSIENGRRFPTPLVVRVAYLPVERQTSLRLNVAELSGTYPSKIPFIL